MFDNNMNKSQNFKVYLETLVNKTEKDSHLVCMKRHFAQVEKRLYL